MASQHVSEIVDEIDTLARNHTLDLRNIVALFGPQSFIAIILVPALIVVSPLSGIPFLPSICGLLIAVVASQMLIGRPYVWLPQSFLDKSIDGERAHKAIERIRGVIDWLDSHARGRLRWMVAMPFVKLPQALCISCGLAMPFLELLPFSSSILGLAVVSFCTAFLTRDGLFVVIGMVSMAIASIIPLFLFASI